MEIKRLSLGDKRGDIPSLVFAVFFLMFVGVGFFFVNHFMATFWEEIDDKLIDEETVNTTLDEVVTDFYDLEHSNMWDLMFLVVYMGVMLIMIFTGFLVRTNTALFWIYVLMSMFILFLATVVSNIWQALAENPQFAVTITRFPITNFVLGTYFPTIITAIIMVTMLLLFAKSPRGFQ